MPLGATAVQESGAEGFAETPAAVKAAMSPAPSEAGWEAPLGRPGPGYLPCSVLFCKEGAQESGKMLLECRAQGRARSALCTSAGCTLGQACPCVEGRERKAVIGGEVQPCAIPTAVSLATSHCGRARSCARSDKPVPTRAQA